MDAYQCANMTFFSRVYSTTKPSTLASADSIDRPILLVLELR